MKSNNRSQINAISLPLIYPADSLLHDLSAGSRTATGFFTTDPHLPCAKKESSDRVFPAEVSNNILAYQLGLQADIHSQKNAEALVSGEANCVLTGQQAGLLGGPAYTAYKIATAVRLARQESDRSGRLCVPVFWLASEDHDLGEANHTFGTKSDGEIGRVSFRSGRNGHELAGLPVDDQVIDSVERYFANLLPSGDERYARAAYLFDGEATFTNWVARSWMRLFAGTGLVIVEPALLRPAFGELFHQALQQRETIGELMANVAAELRGAGYRVPLDPKTAGTPFRIHSSGSRLRVSETAAAELSGISNSRELSTDAALRPIFADALLPNIAHVVGTSELGYHAMLKPLYGLFGVTQPSVLPRRSLTFISEAEAETLDCYGLTAEEALVGGVSLATVTSMLLKDTDSTEFDRAAREIRSAFQPLSESVQAVDPNLERTWQRSRDHALYSLERLRSRTGRALLARRGYSRAVLHRLLNQLRPRGRPQERIFPVPHFLARFGTQFLQACLMDEPHRAFTHEVVILPAAPVSR